ncbi:flagellar brake protein [Methylomonas koyamae]|uniref:flagellar brake protein n=1 Tax=Methylomonas koyamae TaxID=702114 RepID=UPI00112AE36C|nr:flagellar brake protein [Methylomonas koyamae]TPQ28319.1 flagellar brake protein [Methylomonas koyamae]
MEKESDYLVRGSKLVFGHLTDLVKKKCIISAHFGEHNQSFLTTIIDLDQKANLLALDVAPTELLNKQLLNSPKVLFRTEYEGIKVSFRGKSIKKSQSDGHPVLAMPIPDAIFWMQRRQFYRVKVPLSHANSLCVMMFTPPQDPDDIENTEPTVLKASFRLVDLSFSGFAFLNPDSQFDKYLNPEDKHEGCMMYLHDGGQAKISFEIKEITRVRATVTGTQQRVGCRFTDIPPAFETNIQRYMQDIEIQQKNLA